MKEGISPKGQSLHGAYARGIAWTATGNLIAMGASLVTVTVAARLLDKGEVGAFFIVNLVVFFVATFSDLGLRNTAIKFLSTSDVAEIGPLANYIWSINLLAALVAGALVALSHPLLLGIWDDPYFAAVSWYTVPAVILQILFQISCSLVTGYRKFASLSVLSAVAEGLRMILSVLLLLAGLRADGLMLGIIFSRIVVILLLLRQLPVLPRLSFSHHRGRELLAYGGWLQGGAVVSALTVRLVDGILSARMGAAALAAYATAMQIPSALQRLFEAVRPVVMGYVASLRMNAAEQAVEALRLLSGLLSVAAIVLMAGAEQFVRLAFSDRYLDAVPIMQLLGAWMSLGLVNYYISITLIGMGASKKAFLLTLPQFAVMLCASLVFVPQWQGEGAAAALILTSLAGNLVGCSFVADGDHQLFRKLCIAFLRSAIPVFLSLAAVRLSNMSPSTLLLISPVMLLGIFLGGGIRVSDIKRLIACFFPGRPSLQSMKSS